MTTREPEDFPRAGKLARVGTGLLFLLLGLIALLSCVVMANQLSWQPEPRRTKWLLVLSAWLAFVCLLFSFRLFANRPSPHGGLMSPLALRLGALFFGGLPLASLATGAWRNNHTSPMIWQGMIYLGIAYSLFRLASYRAKQARTVGSIDSQQ